jgi:hypothetical protein
LLEVRNDSIGVHERKTSGNRVEHVRGCGANVTAVGDNTRMDLSQESTHPRLASWLKGASADHPIVQLSQNREEFDRFAVPLEEIISTLETANPERLPGRRKSFRTNVQQFLDIRVELNAAYQVARAGIPFSFGKEGGNSPSEPDLCCDLNGTPVYIEVTAKSPLGIGSLHDALEAELSDCKVYITLNVSSILRISDEARRAIVTQIREACERMSGTTETVALPVAGGSAFLEKPSPFGGTSVVWMNDFGQDIGPSEDIFCEAVRVKREQSLEGNWPKETLLVIDAARLGHAVWLRPDGAWAGRLPQLELGWETLPFLGVALVVSTVTAAGFRGAAAPRPGLSEDHFALFVELCGRLSLQVA